MTTPTHSPTTPLLRRDLVRWQHLVVPHWLALLQAGSAVEATPAGAWCVLEVGSDGGATYAQGHVAGALYVDTHWLEAPPLWKKVSDDALLAVLLGLGIAHDTTVILLGRTATAVGRVAHLMLYAGVRDVRILDGGAAAWQRAGLPWAQGSGHVPQRVQAPCPPAGFGVSCPAQPQWMLTMAQAEQYTRTPGAALVSVRTWGEHTGHTSGYDYISAKGDIPGALWGHSDSVEKHELASVDVNGMGAFHTDDGCMRSAADIAAMWRAAGIHPGLQLGFYCGTGWRASLAFFYAWLMGWERIAVFDGGWLEWSAAHAAGNAPVE